MEVVGEMQLTAEQLKVHTSPRSMPLRKSAIFEVCEHQELEVPDGPGPGPGPGLACREMNAPDGPGMKDQAPEYVEAPYEA